MLLGCGDFVPVSDARGWRQLPLSFHLTQPRKLSGGIPIIFGN
jgi:hypothetical protein